MQTEQVAARARQVETLGADATLWTEAHPGLARKSEAAVLRRLRRKAGRLAVAASRPPCVAVFGASQAGKSYLVANLATPAGRPLAVRYGEETLDFLRDMNPVGGGESTGLVSRFTLRPPKPPEGAPPVPVRLLSRTDVICIVANTYLSDFKPVDARHPTPDELTQSLSSLPTGQGPFTVDDIEEIREYFEKRFRTHAAVQAIGASFWLQLLDQVERLPIASCVEALAPLWGGTPQFTALVLKLLAALERLGFPDVAFCGVEALKPREESILNVSALLGLGGVSAAADVGVVSAARRTCRLDRAVVAALVAELAVPLELAAWPFLERTDLLDFPGARSREEITDVGGFLAKPEQLGHAFLRGKVAFLFQRYQAEQEVTAMLLCVGDSAQETQSLPGMVDEWVRETLGDTPEARASQRDSLFVVLTKFDRELESKSGEDLASGERWSMRLNSSLLGFFRGSWVREWKPARPFDNVLWLRSTSIGFDAVFDYVGDGPSRREHAVGSRAVATMATRRNAYLANELVVRHVRDPARAWDEVMSPGNGGVAFLAGRLEPVCDETIKVEQVAARIEDVASDMASHLRPHFRSGDVDAEVKKAFRTGMTIARPLAECASRQMFGPLLRALQVSRDQMVDVWRLLQTRPGADPVPIGAVGDADDIFTDLFGEEGAEIVRDSPSAATVHDRFEQFADMALDEWARTCGAFAQAPETEASFRMPTEQATVLVSGLATLAARLDLRDALARRLRTECSHQSRITTSGEKQAAIVASEIGDFVLRLGYRDVPEAGRPVRLDDKAHRVFTARPVSAEPPVLGVTASDYTTRFLKDWISALVQRLQENAGDPGADGFDVASNAALGSILQGLAQVPA